MDGATVKTSNDRVTLNPSHKFKITDMTESLRDSAYQVLLAVSGALPIPVMAPCVQLIKEIDATFRRMKLRR
jgi:hypothetical protein